MKNNVAITNSELIEFLDLKQIDIGKDKKEKSININSILYNEQKRTRGRLERVKHGTYGLRN